VSAAYDPARAHTRRGLHDLRCCRGACALGRYEAFLKPKPGGIKPTAHVATVAPGRTADAGSRSPSPRPVARQMATAGGLPLLEGLVAQRAMWRIRPPGVVQLAVFASAAEVKRNLLDAGGAGGISI
jgi:hypothetical protein